jgi:crossover junction endodeoxyribonuclease RuvC
MYFCGLDLSLTSPGYCFVNSNEAKEPSLVGFLKTKDMRGMKRVDVIFKSIVGNFKNFKPKIVVIEGYSYASKGNLTGLAELGGIIRFKLFRMGIEYVEVAPATLKKFATGKGVGDKNKVMLKVFKQWKLEFENDDECDAFVLSVIAKYLYYWKRYKNFQGVKLYDYQKEIIKKLAKEE